LRRAYVVLILAFTLSAIGAGVDALASGRPLASGLTITLLAIAFILLVCANIFIILLINVRKK
jgi:hypothetical protein